MAPGRGNPLSPPGYFLRHRGISNDAVGPCSPNCGTTRPSTRHRSAWWWDEASGELGHHYLDGHADISQALAEDLAGVGTASEWQSRLAQLRASSSSSSGTMRTVVTSVWSPVDVLLTTISHWALRW